MERLSGNGSLDYRYELSTAEIICRIMIATIGVISTIPIKGMILRSGARIGSVI
jgi:hypothetical protein